MKKLKKYLKDELNLYDRDNEYLYTTRIPGKGVTISAKEAKQVVALIEAAESLVRDLKLLETKINKS